MRPVTLLHGDHQLTSSDLVGSASGFRKSKLVDNFIHNVLRTEEQQTTLWTDNRLTTACRHGHTLIYDEFNRTPPAANAPLLSVLAEGILNLPRVHEGRRMTTVPPQLPCYPHVKPRGICRRLRNRRQPDRPGHHHQCRAFRPRHRARHRPEQSGLGVGDAAVVVDLVRALRLREDRQQLTVRGALALARVTVAAGIRPELHEPMFRAACRDILHATDADLKTALRPDVRPEEGPGMIEPLVRRRRVKGAA